MTSHITCPELDIIPAIQHAFFTRKLPGSTHSYSEPANRHIAMQQLGLQGSDLSIVKQEHTADVVIVEAPLPLENPQVADAMVTNIPGLVLGILTADCTPVLFVDKTANVIGAAHAGWKGAKNGVLENTVTAMVELGASAANITAAIGPCIQQFSYEVGPEFYESFLNDSKHNHRYFIPSIKPTHFMFDMPAFVTEKLVQAGVGSITNLHRDTCSDEEHFFSYRRCCLRGETYRKNGLSAIMLRG